jgi:hypothetical protein
MPIALWESAHRGDYNFWGGSKKVARHPRRAVPMKLFLVAVERWREFDKAFRVAHEVFE